MNAGAVLSGNVDKSRQRTCYVPLVWGYCSKVVGWGCPNLKVTSTWSGKKKEREWSLGASFTYSYSWDAFWTGNVSCGDYSVSWLWCMWTPRVSLWSIDGCQRNSWSSCKYGPRRNKQLLWNYNESRFKKYLWNWSITVIAISTCNPIFVHFSRQ